MLFELMKGESLISSSQFGVILRMKSCLDPKVNLLLEINSLFRFKCLQFDYQTRIVFQLDSSTRFELHTFLFF